MNEKKPEFPCSKCGKETVVCPLCYGDDPYGKEGQYDGFMVCQDEECPEYQFCCGC